MTAEDDEALRQALQERQGLVPTSRLARLWKGGRTAAGLARTMLFRRSEKQVSDAELESVARLVERLGELKGVAMKAGQILGYVDTALPPELRTLLSALQTSAQASPFSAVEEVLRTSLGDRAEPLLRGLGRAPVAVASIGQVHEGRLPDGTHVAVKVRHRGVREALMSDFDNAGAGALFASVMAPGVGVASFIAEARQAVLEECDFALEARRQRAFSAFHEGDPVIRVPRVEEAWSTPDVLTSQWLPGRSLLAYLEESPGQAERDRFGEALFRFYLGTLYRHGQFHADPHPGNFAFRTDGGLVFYDFGCVRTFGPATVRALARLVGAVRDDDPGAIASALTDLGARAAPGRKDQSQVRELLRGFFAPLLHSGVRAVAPGEAVATRQLMEDKRAIMKLGLPGHLLFLFRLRFGVFSVLATLGSRANWAELEAAWAAEAAR